MHTAPIPMPKPGLYPFWFWNGVQDEAMIDEQLRLMKEGACRGVVLHSRHGNKIPYLSGRWFELVAHACETAERLGLKIWLYDEDGYPSGNAGGQVQRLRPDLRQKHLVFEYAGTDPEAPAFAAYDVPAYGLLDEAAVAKGTPALRFKLEYVDRHVDAFSREAGELFVSLTHTQYAQHLSRYFGGVVEAVYTDDECFQIYSGFGVPWSEVLDAEYTREHGEPLAAVLPLLVEDLPGADAARNRFYRCARRVFLENFIGPQIEWCHRHGLAYLGHLCGDEGPTRNAVKNFGSVMPFMLAEDVPSIDDYLCERVDQRYLSAPLNSGGTRMLSHDNRRLFTLLIYKFASSVANQFKDGLVSVEDLTFLSWRVQPEFIQAQMLYELAMGANLMTPHAYYYTVGGGTKYDCPPSYFFQQPFHGVFGRCCVEWTRAAELLLRGDFHADCLVVYPDRVFEMEAGTELIPAFEPRLPRARMTPDEFDVRFNELLLELARRHIGFELGDDAIMAERGAAGNGVLTLGARSYTTVVRLADVPVTEVTERLLEKFAANGGRVLTVPPDGFAAFDALAPDIALSGAGNEEILVHARNNNGFREAFLVNLSGRALSPALEVGGRFVVCGACGTAGFRATGGLPPEFVLEAGAACFILPPDAPCGVVPFEETAFNGGAEWEETAPVSIDRLRGNVAALPRTAGFKFGLEPGATVDAVYAENLHGAGLHINGGAAGVALPHHPCDACFEGVDVSGLCRPGENRVALDAACDMVYLEGEFMFEDGVLKTPRPLATGDLARNGLPHYWGGVDYTFEFTGRHALMRLDLAGGAAKVFVNGAFAGHVFGRPAVVRIGALCADDNTATVRVYNTAANFITAEPAPFGLVKAEITRHGGTETHGS